MISTAIMVFLDIIIKRDWTFCFSEECILTAEQIFKTPISLLKQSLIFIPVFVFFIGLYNYKLAIINTKNNNILNKERDFYAYLKENPSDKEDLLKALNKKKLFNALFDDELNFNTGEKEKIELYIKNRKSHGVITLLDENKKEAYKKNILIIPLSFGFTIDDELDIERMDEIVNSICVEVIEIIEIWFSITIKKE